MILLNDLISMLTTGAFANTTFSGTNGELKDIHKSKVANLINLGTIELYKRFKFLENELSLHVTPDVHTYYLRADRATVLANITSSLYIESAPDVDGFLNIIKVIAAFDSSGQELRINTSKITTLDDLLTPIIISLGTDVLQITNVTAPQVISVVYQSYPNKITTDDIDDGDTVSLSIPDVIIDPLLAYVASKTFKPMGANDSTANADKSVSYEQAYELACQKISMYGLNAQDTTDRDTFDSNGWA